MRKTVPFLLGMLLLAGCGDGGAARRAYLDSLVGRPEQEVVRQRGVPSRTYETGGQKFLAYDDRRLDIVPDPFFVGGFGGYGRLGGPFFGYYGGYGYPPLVVERGCETTFEVSGGRVQSWSLRGNSCQ